MKQTAEQQLAAMLQDGQAFLDINELPLVGYTIYNSEEIGLVFHIRDTEGERTVFNAARGIGKFSFIRVSPWSQVTVMTGQFLFNYTESLEEFTKDFLDFPESAAETKEEG